MRVSVRENCYCSLTCMGTIADPVSSHTGLTGPFLAVYYHFGLAV